MGVNHTPPPPTTHTVTPLVSVLAYNSRFHVCFLCVIHVSVMFMLYAMIHGAGSLNTSFYLLAQPVRCAGGRGSAID
jgi:ABC-type transport system involved in cytochrome c biogenesis permease subunit